MPCGLGFLLLGALWLGATVAGGYPIGMVGRDLHGDNNMLPPTLAMFFWNKTAGHPSS
ncbi:hypothetical protein [Marinobacter halophilus]|uniref:hypothetical protein n=1 Tax=Marinobacter halophilus TaxID=1323740 RepID=UPI0013FE3DFC|nr:hypothetical protein [Marinobacter halophilus]GGC66202.1 hypothetical protein GCM10011362_13270 [Marinobacter halophilus]